MMIFIQNLLRLELVDATMKSYSLSLFCWKNKK